MLKLGGSRAMLMFIALFSLVVIFTQRWNGDHWKDAIASDGLGYYEYLPALFISKDLGAQNDSLAKAMVEARSLVRKDGAIINKYTYGTALLQSPFFFVGHLVAGIIGKDQNGYTRPYQISISIAALFYLLLGLWWLRALLRTFEFGEKTIGLTLLIIFFGTNLLYYALMQAAMSHVYSFCVIAGTFLFIRRTALHRKKSDFVWASLLFGVLIVIRPANLIAALAIPVLMPSAYWSEWIKIKWSFTKTALISGPIALAIIFLQPLLWKMQGADFFTWPYSGEGFYWGSPELKGFLFSFRKGLFVYSPLLLLALPGLWKLFRKDAERALNCLIYMAVFIYLSSCWWNWYYGDSYGQRVIIDHLALFAMLIAYGWQHTNRVWVRSTMFIATLAFIGMNLIQSWQYENGIMDRYNMNLAKYKYIFMKTGEEHKGVLGGAHDVRPYSRDEPQLLVRARTNIETMEQPFFGGKMVEDDELAYSGKVLNELNENEEYSTTFSYFSNDTLLDGHRMYLVVELKRLQPEVLGSEYALGVVSISSPDVPNWFYSSYRMNDVPPSDSGTWEQMRYAIDLPGFKMAKDELKFYIWNKERQHFYIDDLMVSLHRIK